MPEVKTTDSATLHAALGEFVLSFALFEEDLHRLFRLLTGVNEEVARIVFPDMRSGLISDLLPQLLKLSVLPIPARERLLRINSQFKLIVQMRNDLVHQSNAFETQSGKLWSMDYKRKAFGVAALTRTEYSLNDINSAREDLPMMQREMRIISLCLPGGIQDHPGLPYDESKNVFLGYSWQYKLVQPLQLPKDHPRSSRNAPE